MNEHLLIVEDDIQLAQVLQQGLEQEASWVAVAQNGYKGLEMPKRATEYLLAEALMRNASYVVSREEIGKVLWGSRTVIEQNSIDVHVRGLRAKVDQAFPDKLI